ncbi:MAG: phytoene/squalene synthase family protein [Beijerinckiaceae bacterium]
MSSLFDTATARADIAACHALLRHGSKSFHAASLLLPRRVREPATALYAFCRVADDAVDLSDDPASAIGGLERRLDAVFAGRPMNDPIDRALARVAESCDLPRAPLDLLLDGFAWDAAGKRYETLSDVTAYAVRVAGTVGVLMSALMGGRAASTLARACDLGVAMQLVNIARDVGEDARMGRLYLPRQWLAEAGVDADAFLTSPAFDARLGSVVARLIAEAEKAACRAADGVASLPLDCRPAIHAARLIYGEIGREVARQGFNSIDTRAVVAGQRKLALVAEAVASSASGPSGRPWPTLPEARALIGASARYDTAWRPASPMTEPGRALKLLAIYDKLKRQDSTLLTTNPG